MRNVNCALGAIIVLSISLSACNSDSLLDNRGILELSDGVLDAINRGDTTMIAQEAAALKEQRSERLFDPDFRYSGCSMSEISFSESIVDGAGWAKQWLSTKSEKAARDIIAKPRWFRELTKASDSQCEDPSFVSSMQKAKTTFGALRKQVDELHPQLAGIIERENEERYAAQERDRVARYQNCDLTDREQQRVFDHFVRLEDNFGKDNAANEAAVAETVGVTPDCVRSVIILGLELGREPPAPSY